MGFEFVLPHDFESDDPGTHHEHPVEDEHHQRLWHCCGKCGVMFWAGAQATSRCPADGGQHIPSTDPQSAQEFFLAHDLPADATHQDRWQVCTQCAGMFFNGFDDFKGVCPHGGVHTAAGFNFVLPHNPGADAFTEDGWRFCGRCFAMVDTKHPDLFNASAGWVVRNADHPDHLPQDVSELGVVLLGFAWGAPCTSRIAWIPLHPGQPPRLTDTRYYTGGPGIWSEHADDAAVILEHDDFTSVSIAWLDGPKRWICLYSKASPHKRPDGPAVVRLGTSPWDWSEEVTIFDPVRTDAPPAQKPYGVYMHKQGIDSFATDIPPSEPPDDPHDGWAYGVYLLWRFTTWNEQQRELTISYLLSLSSPYQPQLMQTRLHLPGWSPRRIPRVTG
jgi:hypothetical protein